MPITETVEQIPCCIKFLQELLKTNANLSEEEFISLSSEFHHTYEVPAVVRFDGEGCFTLPVRVEEEEAREYLLDEVFEFEEEEEIKEPEGHGIPSTS
ncbi:hypothetical protein MTR_3g012370 [Medicago truncatula]|uniref:Uncharacterized protein n=1 Tax=Medicago truncatula TaxID=3880 RepID=A0A072UUF2_MEDTR|nr:hypothetical protein MTR_3g012370 [Medicago truncatula]